MLIDVARSREDVLPCLTRTNWDGRTTEKIRESCAFARFKCYREMWRHCDQCKQCVSSTTYIMYVNVSHDLQE